MLKPDSKFKLKKEFKRIIASYIDPHKRGEARRAFIQAQLQSEIVIRPSKKDRGSFTATPDSNE